MTGLRRVVLLALCAPLAGCMGTIGNETDGGPLADAGPLADGGTDAGAPDAGTRADAGAVDSGRADAGSQDAGSPDAGTRDAGTPLADGGTTIGCAGKSYLLCEDFDSTPVGSIPSGWTSLPDYGTGTVAVASDQFHSGGRALKGDSASGGQPRIQKSLASLGALAGHHWGRLFYKVQTPTPHPNAYFQVVFAGLLGSTESRVVDTVSDPSGTTLQYLYDLPDDSCCGGSGYNWSFDGKWHCAEWYVDNTTQTYRFFVDEQELSSIGFTGRAGARLEVFSALGIGTEFFIPPATPLVAWIDDLAVDTRQIGCR